ncbi:aspartate/glutamate racemase family protein [Rhodovulum kholense]|uniref:Asp/Glu/hydantoin racemase n=1 Tax=Rhodovulum kholense TaxID=453584 RepID=A0A8E2VMM2_9RHOB|nr:aspartate/glutamate racemase family protein [Rhodovulum kholense]PTW51403.1 Asp/Glu/hydantoin racemase [Rhodovulum kholense]
MRLLLVNPNMTEAMTDRMAEIARTVAPPETEILPLTAKRGFPYIASRAEAQIGGALAYDLIAEHAEGTDAAIIAAFGDPGLAGARELFDFPIVGMAEAALMSAAMLGERISIVTFSPVMRRWYGDSVRDAGLMPRFTGVRTPPAHVRDLANLQQNLRPELIRLCAQAVEEDNADVVILGGAPLAGLAPEIANEVEALVVDPITAATVQAQALVSLGSQAGFARRRSKPLAKAASGLPDALTRQFGRDMDP